MRHTLYFQMQERDNSMIHLDQLDEGEIPLVDEVFRQMISLIYLAHFLDEDLIPVEQGNQARDEEKT